MAVQGAPVTMPPCRQCGRAAFAAHGWRSKVAIDGRSSIGGVLEEGVRRRLLGRLVNAQGRREVARAGSTAWLTAHAEIVALERVLEADRLTRQEFETRHVEPAGRRSRWH